MLRFHFSDYFLSHYAFDFLRLFILRLRHYAADAVSPGRRAAPPAPPRRRAAR